MAAATSGHHEIAQQLLQAGADPNYKDAIGYTALALAVEAASLESVEVLVRAGAEVNQAVTYDNTPLILACEKGAVEIGEFLLAHGADPLQVNRDRETALMKAATAGSLPLVQILTAQGVDVNAISKERQTAIALATGASRYVEVNPNDRNSHNRIREYREDGTCWEYQPLSEDLIIEVVQTLLQAGADPNLLNCHHTPLIEAAGKGYLRLVQLLLQVGAKLDVRDRNGDTAVSLAKLYNRQQVLEFLREYTGTDLSDFEKATMDGDFEDDFEDNNDFEDDESWDKDLPQPDFSEAALSLSYQQAVADLAEICGGTSIGNDEVPGWFSIHVNTKRRKDIKTADIQNQFLARGCFVYEPDSYRGDGPAKLCILPTTDKYEAIAVHQTNGYNYDIGPSDVVAWLRELEAEQPFILTCIAHDTLAGRFLTAIVDPEGLAERMYEFCPDIVDQGCGSVEILGESLAENDSLFFWWD
jgi:ankyrin repeat protein